METILSNAGLLGGVGSMYQPNKFAVGFEWDGKWGHEVQNIPYGIAGRTVAGWTNLCAMVYDQYKVNYHVEGGNDHSETFTAKDLPKGLWSAPAKEGYTFDGWYQKAADIGNPNKKTGNIDILKKWELYGKYTANVAAAKTYTITYTDGVDGEDIFADQVTRDIAEGTATPAFNGTPARDGYVFKGWSPAVAETVTENATYAAQWEKKAVTYTVTYKDGANGKVFTDKVFSDLKAGDKTPDFGKVPARRGYRFAGWDKKVADTVTGNAVYTATWKARCHAYHHCDKLLQTGQTNWPIPVMAILGIALIGTGVALIEEKKWGKNRI